MEYIIVLIICGYIGHRFDVKFSPNKDEDVGFAVGIILGIIICFLMSLKDYF